MARRTPGTDALGTYRSMRDFGRTPEPRGRVGKRQGRLYTIQKHAATRLHYDLRLELDGVLKSWAITRGPSFDPAEKRLAVRTEDHPMEYARFEGRIPKGNYGAGTVLLWDEGTWEPLEDPREGLEKGKLKFRLYGERLVGRWTLVRMRPREGERGENWLMIKERDAHAAAEREPTEEFADSVQSGRDLDAVRRAPDAVWQGLPEPKEPQAPTRARKTTAKAKTAARKKSRKKSHHPLPPFVEPALAKLVDGVPTSGGWIFEVKFDGYRTLASVSGSEVRLSTRSGLDWTEKYGGIARALAALDLDGALLDGEVVAIDAEGRSDFGTLQAKLKDGKGALAYFVFDLLAEGGEDLRRLPQLERKRRLAALLAHAEPPIHYTDHLERGGERMLSELCARGFEGVIAKRADAPYKGGRIGVWLKIKCERAQEFVVVGWAPSDKSRSFASLLLGVHEDGRLRYAGKVGAGFGERDLSEIHGRLVALERKTPAVEGVPRATARRVHWVTPKLVAEVEFAEFTRDGLVRHARFRGLRVDKPASAIVRERAAPVEVVEEGAKVVASGARGRAGARATKVAKKATNPARTKATAASRDGADDEARVAGVRLTHPERVLFPGQALSKRDLALYLEAIAPRMLPHVEQRLVSLVRCPDGSTGECFFQRHVGKGMPDAIRGLDVEESDGSTKTYLWLDGVAGLVATAQIGALEVHVWGSRIDDVDRPDRLVMDLDPDPAVPFRAVKEAANEMRDALQALGIRSFPLVTGGKGVHVVAPLRRTVDWDTLKAFTRALAERFADEAPDRFVANMSKARRKGRIFVDYLRNDRTATAIAPYSVRARERATVATPVTWAELAGLASAAAFGVDEVRRRAQRRDPWAGYFELRQTIKASALKALGAG